VRLKGGDPFVFGRGGEEAAVLRAAGVAVEVIPGLTSGLAAPAALGIPVTYRATARGVALVTGHTHNGDEPDWRALVASRLTLVIYMGTRRARELRAALLAAGMAPCTPVAVIANATRAEQRGMVTTLRELARARTLASPAIIVVGDVVACASLDYPARYALRG
jgi:uroporphyrin-III C-methyltransferase